MRCGVSCLLLVCSLRAQELDADTRAGMDAEVAGDWVAAVEAFARAAETGPRDARKARRLRNARRRGFARWSLELDAHLQAKRYEEAARALQLARRIDPKHHKVKGALKRLTQLGVALPELPPAGEKAHPLFPRRSPGGRVRCWPRLGGAFTRAETTIDGGLDFLVQTQEDEGSWDAKKHGGDGRYSAGVASLALLALLTRGPEGLEGERGQAARRAASYLQSAQAADGFFGTKETITYMYQTALATEALAEYAVLAGQLDALKPKLEKARDFLLAAQSPGAGWRYEPRDESDTSVTAMVVAALHGARRAGLAVPDTAFTDAVAWVAKMTDKEYGQIGYNFPGGAPARPEGLQDAFPPEHSHSMTAAGSLVLVYAGAAPKTLPLSLDLVRALPPGARYPDMYYWQVGARAFVAAHGSVPREWYEALVAAVASCRRSDGGMRASGVWGADGGRIYATAMCVLALAAPYREPPPAGADQGNASAFLEKKERTVGLAAVAGEIATGIYVDPGRQIRVEARGHIVPWIGGPKVTVHGIKHKRKSYRPLLKSAPFGCLLGRVGPDGKPFRLKPEKKTTLKDSGQLYLLVNDERPADGKKSWRVTVRLER
ncbi:MAG: prenyltransferase/squalene oxidase repeat-containing protein [Planctomycetota bacterium]